VIYGRHEVGDMLVKAPITEDFISGAAAVMVIETA
jgi:hypothetical protein